MLVKDHQKSTRNRKLNRNINNPLKQIKVLAKVISKDLKKQREREREREQSPTSEPSTPTTLVGNDEYFPNDWTTTEQQHRQYQATLRAHLNYQQETYQDYQKRATIEIKRLRECLKTLENEHDNCQFLHQDNDFLNISAEKILNELDNKQEEIKQLTDHKDILIKQAAEQQEIINEHQQLSKSKTTKIKQLQKTNQKISKKLEQLESRLAKDQARKKLWKEKWEQDQKIIAKLILKNQNYQSIIKQKDQQLKSKRVEINQAKRKLLNKQQAEISKLKSDNQHLQQQVQQAQQRANNLQTWKDNHVCICPNIWCANGDYAKVKQQRDNYQQQLDNHTCPTIDNRELENLRIEVQAKDQKITELEQEIKALKDKPPVVDNSEVERLLTVVEEKEQVIKELEIKLSKTEPQIIKVENGKVKELRNELVRQEKRITRLHMIYLLILSTAALVGLVSLVQSKISKKKPR